MNEFSKKSNARNNVYRSTHDLSFQNNLTLKFGAITPVFCREVLPGDSFRIKPTFGIRALPLVFPCQTRMRAYLHFFYVRNRTLWKDWTDFITGTKSNLTSPYIDASSNVQYRASSLADYLGLPCVAYSTDNNTSNLPYLSVGQYVGSFSSPETITKSPYLNHTVDGILYNAFTDVAPGSLSVGSKVQWPSELDAEKQYYEYAVFSISPSYSTFGIIKGNAARTVRIIYLDSAFTVIKNESVTTTAQVPYSMPVESGTRYVVVTTGGRTLAKNLSSSPSLPAQTVFSGTAPSRTSYDADDMRSNPFRTVSMAPSALPFRAYDSIYNAFYRNQQVEPLIVNGQPEYNKFVVNDNGGADVTPYQLRYRNWEDDVFTSCLPSPQMGNAPMVGVTVNGDNSTSLAFSDSDGNVYSAIPVLNPEKNGISSFTIKSSTDSSVIPVTAALSSGITINDFRNVNALQRYLELSQLRGYRYRDLMDAHFNVNIRYNELLMPEFIGGCSRDINVSQITATANTSVNGVETQVGDYKAQAGLVGECNSMACTCDEHGFIIGLMTIVPVPVYGQQLQKFWLKRSQFDYFSPEFANIGYQAVPKREIAPLAVKAADLNTAFGYQRPWYEYLSSLDQSHGLFNTSLRNFILNRSFGSDINLNGQFIKVDPSQLNDIFSSTLENDDKFLGELYFDVRVKTAVPSSVLPKIE